MDDKASSGGPAVFFGMGPALLASVPAVAFLAGAEVWTVPERAAEWIPPERSAEWTIPAQKDPV